MEEILKLITWHHLAFILALVFIIVFKQPLSEFIRRITKINKEGLTAEQSPEVQGEKTYNMTQSGHSVS